ncbi:MAG: N-acetylmuramoyl-L-alanine amidase [Lachnospiraceae bacterium]|nr:N-acetylmuramoyl-L-alanine amidase [Lachnospiraceae bacterium]
MISRLQRKHLTIVSNKKFNTLRIRKLIILSVFFIFFILLVKAIYDSKIKVTVADTYPVPVLQDFLDPNPYSRPQTKLVKVEGIVIHYVANPGTTASANRDYFNKISDRYASSHFIVGLDGEIVQCIPLDEIAYASNDRNDNTIAIECCHPDSSGKFNKATYNSLIRLTAWLCGKYDVPKKNIIRHYDVNGKMCPLYYVKHEKKWNKLKDDVFDYIRENAISDDD